MFLSLSSWGLPFCLFCSVSRVPWFCLSRLISRLVGVDLQQLPDEGCLPLRSDKVFISPCIILAEGGIPGWKVLPSGLEGPSLIQEPVGGHSDFLSSAVSLTPFRGGSSSFFFSFPFFRHQENLLLSGSCFPAYFLSRGSQCSYSGPPVLIC